MKTEEFVARIEKMGFNIEIDTNPTEEKIKRIQFLILNRDKKVKELQEKFAYLK